MILMNLSPGTGEASTHFYHAVRHGQIPMSIRVPCLFKQWSWSRSRERRSEIVFEFSTENGRQPNHVWQWGHTETSNWGKIRSHPWGDNTNHAAQQVPNGCGENTADPQHNQTTGTTTAFWDRGYWRAPAWRGCPTVTLSKGTRDRWFPLDYSVGERLKAQGPPD